MTIPFLSTINKANISTTKNTTIYKIFFFIRNFFLIFILGIFYYLTQPLKSNSVVFIPQGSISQIITYLKQNKYQMSNIDKY
ncbi:aminodeoxychorismate lyase, partial [Campylobacter jejuni]|nr:aminodeoxychorismate lyase [Campylobacter jejuni]